MGQLSDEEILGLSTYANSLRLWWSEIRRLAIEFRAAEAIKDPSQRDLANRYLANLTRLWGELYPKIQGRNKDFGKEFIVSYEKFSTYYYDPSQLIGQGDEVYKLEMLLRETLEKLRITAFEDVGI